MLESAVLPHAFSQHFLARMTKRCVPEIMRKRNRFRQILIKRQSPGNGATHRCHFAGMRQTSTQMISCSVQKNLGLVLEPAKSARMDDPRSIALKFGPVSVLLFRE